MFFKVIFAIFFCGMYPCSANPVRQEEIGDDKANWEAVWKEIKNRPDMSTLDENTFDKIVRINAKERGGGSGRSDGSAFLFEGDIEMSKSEATNRIQSNGKVRQKRGVTNSKDKLWPRNVPYSIDSSLSGTATNSIRGAVSEWEKTLFDCLGTWRDVTQQSKPTDYMEFFRGRGCYSFVGRQGGRQRISIGNGCENHGIVVHEIGHAMGLWHEQSRPDRDQFVTIFWDNIIENARNNFQKQSSVDSLGVPYDYDSVMHYGPRAFSRNGLKTIDSKPPGRQLGQRNGLSEKDIQQVQLLYGCSTTTTTTTTVTETTTKPTTKPTDPSGCRNIQTARNCEYWKGLGYCTQTYVAYMKINCCDTCCQDIQTARNCQYWKGLGFCTQTYVAYMEANCCKTCQSAPSCTDKNTSGNCKTWASYGFCLSSSRYSAWMKINCAESCGCP